MESVVKLNRKLGVGGCGIVYEGFDHAKGQFVAVKELPYMEPSLAGGEDTELAEILRELACMREGRHPNLVQYYGARRSAVGVQIIMEYVSGGSLDYVLTRCGPLRETVARAYTRDVLEALRYLHEVMHVCHRDVKPANILITPEGRCKLADFGVAKHVEETPPRHPPLSNSAGEREGREGRLQTAVGTPWYMAPEVINGGVEDDDEEGDSVGEEDAKSDGRGEGNAADNVGTAKQYAEPSPMESSLEDWSNAMPAFPSASTPGPDPPPLYSSTPYYNPLKRIIRKGRLARGSVGYTTRADIWSVGVTVYEMVTGTRPFGADLHNPSAVLFRIANCATAPPRLPPGLHVSPTLQSFLDLCFVYDKDLRATARELLGHPWLRDASPAAGTARESIAHRLSDSDSLRATTPAPAGQHVDSGAPPPPQQQQQPQLSVRRSVFDGVPLLDAMDLPAYSTAARAPSPSPRENSKSKSYNTYNSGSNGEAGSAAGGQHSRPGMHRLSSAGIRHTFLPSPTSTVEASLVSPEEQEEAYSRYAAARQRIGHARSSAPRAPAVQPPHGNSDSAGGRDGGRGGGGIQTKYGAFVDLLSYP
ncbi:putative protein kinase [Leptomonas pyrrhocoris]|uniref:Protein kinase domain-containing protein n=1 Tax=Leptomonas pyrrhocoris TaxID=157538 RepID=A0A0N0DV15_LEPPY|nr:putative protein kinase [Leptomonas pyrrhocoris]KPA79718.1 putative protein kinase [Leptomonas pyrrhocoris]|eukprot:XP_015658157.1 putative protein kinase [Leptomonas pyrrhocoris]